MNNKFFEKSKRGRGKAKHAVLDQYLKGFFAIQCQCRTWNTPVLYIDGFAGSGTYKAADENSSDEIGSPIVAYKAATEHSLISNFDKKHNKIMLIFVEKHPDTSKKLHEVLTKLEHTKADSVKKIVQFRVVNDDFASFLEKLLPQNEYDNEEFYHSPMFVFADPFGYAGKTIPMVLFKKLMERQANQWLPTSLFITVMDGFARRFISDARKATSLNALMGDENWHHLTEQGHLTPEERRTEFIELYISNLKRDIPKALTLKFAVKDNRNRHIYHLIYLTTHIRGIQIMKTAMWNRTQTSTDMVFSEWVENRGDDGHVLDKEKAKVAECLFKLFKKDFKGELVIGKTLDDHIWLCTPYISNVKLELKKLLNPFALNKEKAFENIFYKFPV